MEASDKSSDSLIDHFRSPPETASYPQSKIYFFGIPLVRSFHSHGHSMLYESRIYRIRFLRVLKCTHQLWRTGSESLRFAFYTAQIASVNF